MKFLLLFSLASAVLFSGRAFAAGDEETRREAFRSCAKENGVSKPVRGQRPSEEDRAKMKACMTAKGFERPPHHHPRRHQDPGAVESKAGAGE